MTPSRWLGLFILFAASIAPRAADAGITANPATVALGNVRVGSSADGATQLNESTTTPTTIAAFDLTACSAEFTVKTGVPLVVTMGTPETVDFTFAPTNVGAESCTVTMRDATMASLGTFTITGTGAVPVINVNPTSLDFMSVRLTNAVATRNVVLRNNGGVPLTISALTFSGAALSDYSLNPMPTLPIVLAASTQTTITVQFDPSMLGTRAATLEITSDDPAVATTSNVSLTGSGTSGVIAVSDIAFGTVNLGSNSVLNINVTNTGGAPKGTLTVTSATMSGSNGWFTFNASGCAGSSTTCDITPDLAVINNTATVPIRCQPPVGATGSQMAMVQFTSDSDNNTDDTAFLTCTAGRADVMIDQSTLAFGNQFVNVTSAPLTVNISNTGNINLSYSLSLIGANPGQFAVTTGCVGVPCALGAGGNAPTNVTFRPTSTGPKTATLRISSNDPDNPTVDIALNGTGVAPHLQASATSFNFGNVEVGKSGTVTLTVTNTGTADLGIASANFTAPTLDFSVTTGTTGTQTVMASSTTSWMLTCAPSSQGTKSATFRILSNTDATSGAAMTTATDVTLSCTGQQGILTVLGPNPFNFGGVRQGDVTSHVFTIQNTGNVAVTMVNGALGDTTLGYSITAPTFPVATVNPGGTFTTTVQFAPDATHDGGPTTLNFTGSWGAGNTTMAVENINGDGLVAGYDTTPPNQDFGNIRFDNTTTTRQFTIINTDVPPVVIQTLTITPGMNTMSGEFVIQSITQNGNPVTLPRTLPTKNDSLVVTIRCVPAAHIAAISATLTVHSDLGMMPDRNVTMMANITTAMVAVNPTSMVVDFGTHDVQVLPNLVTMPFTITNTGQATLNLGAGARSGPQATYFTPSSIPGPTVIAPGNSATFMISYVPHERPLNQFDVATYTFSVQGVFGGTGTLAIMMQGRGTDRHMLVNPVPAFPNTFRNPDDKAPLMPVTAQNLGEAPMEISAVMLTNDPIFTLENPGPVTVPGFSTYDFNVRFSPTMAGKADAMMMITNDDDANSNVMVALTGMGINRAVDFGPAVIDVGYTGIGIPVRLSQVAPGQLKIVNMDQNNDFVVRELQLGMNSDAFVIEGAAPMSSLDRATTKELDVVFTPDHEGDFETTVTLFLDKDPLAQGIVTLRGHAVFVDASSGCSSGRGTGTGMLLVIGALLLARRRKSVLVVAALCVMPAATRADEPSRNIETSVFHPTPATTGTTFQLQSADVGSSGSWVASAVASYTSRPLVLRTVQNDDVAIARRSTLELGGAFALADKYEFGFHMPMNFMQNGDAVDMQKMFGVAAPPSTTRGDLSLHGKMRLWRNAKAAAGAALVLTLPTATDGQFAGVDKPTGRVLGLYSMAVTPRFSLGLNLGAVLRAKAKFGNLEQGSGAVWAAGASFRALDQLWFTVEGFGELIPGGKHARPMPGAAIGDAQLDHNLEFLGGLHYFLDRRVSVGIAAGRGIKAPALHGMFALTFVPQATERPPIHAHVDHVEGDADGDGIGDDTDKCRTEPEDKDMFDDADGCPDPDNDHDGFADASDKCPLDAEDKDGFQDEDGCPDRDNDEDGITDDKDKCPSEAEDKDGHQDLDGCPDLDNDTDGIPDAKDKCINEPETINGNQDDDGCPDRGDSLVVLSPDRLELLEAIQFTGTKLTRPSNNVLAQVGATLRAHAEILRVRVTVHVQPTNNADRDQELSVKRAQAVRDWLMAFGIEPARVEIRGFGGTKPLVPADTKGAAQINDRLELIILERK